MKSPSGVSKKVIYLDQCLLSRMVKMLDPNFPEHRKLRPEFDLDFVKAAFGKLHRLVKLQLAVCPESPFHHDESSLLDSAKPAAFAQHKRAWELLSCDTSFRTDSDIRNEQVVLCATSLPEDSTIHNWDVSQAIEGDLDSWPDSRIQITLNCRPNKEEIDANRDLSMRYREKISGLYDVWRKEKPTFDQVFERECKALGQCIIQLLAESVVLRQKMLDGDASAGIKFFHLSLSEDLGLFHELTKIFSNHGQIEAESQDRALTFISSDKVKGSPFVRISCALYAELAQRVIQGERDGKNDMPFYDIGSIAAYLPYSHAMFVDRQMHDLLRARRVAQVVSGFGKAFSVSNKNEFLGFLDSILSAAPAHHLEMVRRIYGEKWEEPYFEVLVHDEQRSSKTSPN
jgi:hypothetical protein